MPHGGHGNGDDASARHRERYCASAGQLSTITPEFCPRSNGIAVHDALESLSSMSRNNHSVPVTITRPLYPYPSFAGERHHGLALLAQLGNAETHHIGRL
jgi:hypothetical protein